MDPLAEKYYFESPFCYVGNNPLLFVDPNGKEKFELKAHLKLSYGIMGIGVKAFGIKYASGAPKSDNGHEATISVNLSYDNKSNRLSLGFAMEGKEIKEGGLTFGGIVGGGKTKEKETSDEGSVGINFKSGKIDSESNKTIDTDFKEVEEGTLGIVTGSEKEGEETKTTIGLSPEINLWLLGTGIGINLSVQDNKEKSKEENKENKK